MIISKTVNDLVIGRIRLKVFDSLWRLTTRSVIVSVFKKIKNDF